jgi:flavin-dependent dehydrogenase
MEENILSQNPYLKDIFQNADFLFDQPETINEISFETKKPVENHILMSGDAAGMITPLCGNGMAMAIHSSKILSELLIRYCSGQISRMELEGIYTELWSQQFKRRLWVGRQLQNLFGSSLMSNLAVILAKQLKPIGNYLISKTHGQPF